MGGELALPHLALEPHDSTEAFSTEVETVPIEIVVLGLPAQRGPAIFQPYPPLMFQARPATAMAWLCSQVQ